MLKAYRSDGDELHPLAANAPLGEAVWIDLFEPTAAEIIAVDPLLPYVPTLEDMREIEISNRLYREGATLYLTVLITGLNQDNKIVSGPVTFILTPSRLITIRHHRPKAFDSFPLRADQATSGCTGEVPILLGLFEEITGHQADLLEGVASHLDDATAQIYRPDAATHQKMMEDELRRIGLQGELIGRVRLGLVTLGRALSFLRQIEPHQLSDGTRAETLFALLEDITALEVHSDFLSQRLGATNDVILGLISIAQNQTTKIVSVISVLFMPPTLIASIYGMNFANMPELDYPWAYPAAIGAMLLSAISSLALFKWLKWL